MEVKGLECPVRTKDTKQTSGAMLNTVRRSTLLTHTHTTSPKTTSNTGKTGGGADDGTPNALCG